MRRLTENRSTPPILRDGDLLVATVFPDTDLLHQFSLVVYDDGRFECCERLFQSIGSRTIFHKESGKLERHELEPLV